MDGRGGDFGGRFGSSKGIVDNSVDNSISRVADDIQNSGRTEIGHYKANEEGRGNLGKDFTKSEKFFVFQLFQTSIFQRRFTYSKSIPLCILPNSQTSNNIFYPTPNVGLFFYEFARSELHLHNYGSSQ